VAIDPKKLAIANLVILAGGIYAPRVMAYRQRRRTETRRTVEMRPREAAAPEKPEGGALLTPSQFWPEAAADAPAIGL